MSTPNPFANLSILNTTPGASEVMDTRTDYPNGGPASQAAAASSSSSSTSTSAPVASTSNTVITPAPTLTPPSAPEASTSGSASGPIESERRAGKRRATSISSNPAPHKRPTQAEEEDDNGYSVSAPESKYEPAPALNYAVPPLDRRFYRIDGLTAMDYLGHISSQTSVFWNSLTDAKFYLHIPGDRYGVNPVIRLNLIKAMLTLFFGHSQFEVLLPTPRANLKVEPSYVPCVVACSKASRDKALGVAPNYMVCTAKGNFVPLPFDFDPSIFLGTWGKCGINDSDSHVNVLVAEVNKFLSKPGSAVNRILSAHYDNLPDMYTTRESRIAYLMTTLRIQPLQVTEKLKPSGILVDTFVFRFWMRSPTKSLSVNQQWIDAFGKMSFWTPLGQAEPMEPFLCRHCSSRSHPTGLCPYPFAIPAFEDTPFPPQDPSPAASSSRRGPNRRGPPARGKGKGRK